MLMIPMMIVMMTMAVRTLIPKIFISLLQDLIDNVDDDYYDGDNEEFDVKKIQGDSPGLDDADDDCFGDDDSDAFDTRKFHGDAV